MRTIARANRHEPIERGGPFVQRLLRFLKSVIICIGAASPMFMNAELWREIGRGTERNEATS